jgi:ribosomal RNA assembly protein
MLTIKKSTISKILSKKKKLETDLKVKIKLDIKNNIATFEGDSLDIYTAERVIDALDKNFSFDIAYLLLKPEYILEDIPIRNFTRKTRLMKDVKARIIGKNAKAIRLMANLSDCYITLHDNEVSIIGTFDKIKEAKNAITNLVSGLKHSKIYDYLEKSKKKYKPDSLGLKR